MIRDLRTVIRVLFLLLLILLALPAQAAPKWLTAVPRAVGRSYGNMFTFKHPWVAAQQWMTVGAMLFDEKTTWDAMHRCAGCVEANPTSLYYHRQATGPLMFADALLLSGIETTLTKYGSEVNGDDTTKYHAVWSNLYSLLPAEDVAIHVYAGTHNMAIRGDRK